MKLNEQILIEGLQEALSDSLENMAFIEVMSTVLLDAVPERKADDLLVSVGVGKPVPGRLSLILPDGFVEELAETVAEEEATDALKKDVLSELANTIAGRFLANIFPKREFEMGIPECCDPDRFKLEDYDSKVFMRFDAEGQMVYGIFEWSEGEEN